MTRESIDWAAIEAAWRAGLSARAAARRFGLTHGAVLARARREGWERDASPADPPDPPDPTPERVVAAHRLVIEQGQILTQRLLEEVLAASARIDALAAEAAGDEAGRLAAHARAGTLPRRIAALRDLAQAARLWIALERQAWGLKDGGLKDAPGDDTPRLDLDAALSALAPEERAQLRRIAEIVSGRPAGPAAGP
ncbi:hypothetical protein [Methylobacterium sp. ID0610]|uniref:hypothetical protein n=1 Tax=Methylobacterium carpenticola TaxID=3344827 RepID=UPI0036BC767C